jgi:zinc-ribbon domain
MPQTCSQCQRQTADDAAFCPSCGAALREGPAAPGDTPPAEVSTAAEGTADAAATPAYHFDASRWSLADRITGIATLVLLVCLFLPWFSDNLGIGIYQWSGLEAHWYLYLVMIVCISSLAYLALRAGWDPLPIDVDVPHVVVMTVTSIFDLVLVFLGFIFKPGGYGVSGVGWSFFSFVALIAAIVAAAPCAIPQLRAKTMD